MDVMSRGSVLSSTSVPTSAGLMLSGGWYMGATESPALGSRPLVHHTVNITANAQSGIRMTGLLPRSQRARAKELGGSSMPLGMKMSTVSPPRAGSGLEVSATTFEP